MWTIKLPIRQNCERRLKDISYSKLFLSKGILCICEIFAHPFKAFVTWTSCSFQSPWVFDDPSNPLAFLTFKNFSLLLLLNWNWYKIEIISRFRFCCCWENRICRFSCLVDYAKWGITKSGLQNTCLSYLKTSNEIRWLLSENRSKRQKWQLLQRG